MVRSVLAAAVIGSAAGHGSMTHPKPRNANSSPANGESQGSDLSCTGDACYWYQVGCMIGCPTCQADLTHKGCGDELCCTAEEGLMEPTNNDPEFRTWDRFDQSKNPGQHKYNPWRAPGKAPVNDPCGLASGGSHANTYAVVPGGYNSGDKASEVLPEGESTLWKAGATATVGWALSAQHSGGYSYRLCPKDTTLSEACFQANHLSFSGNSSIHWNDDSAEDKTIMTRTYVDPDGKQWRTNPVPACLQWGESRPHGRATPDCSYGTEFEPGFDEFTQGFLRPANTGKNKFSVMDEVNVPNKPGKYVLGWRWDCEEADQVWTSCADIEIVDGDVPEPAPRTHDADGTCSGFTPGVDSCSSKGVMSRDASGNPLECCDGCWWMYSQYGNSCNGGKKMAMDGMHVHV